MEIKAAKEPLPIHAWMTRVDEIVDAARRLTSPTTCSKRPGTH